MSVSKEDLLANFRIHTAVDLDFVIGESAGLTVGMQRSSSPELKRRVLAAISSVLLGVQSVDAAKKRYVPEDIFEDQELFLGDEVSVFIDDAHDALMSGIQYLQSLEEPSYGRIGAEISLYRIPNIIRSARLLANRGLLLEVVPLLRQALEMVSWAYMAFNEDDQKIIDKLKAQHCVGSLKKIYPNAGRIYGYLSQFTHWGRSIHNHFIGIEEGRGAILNASVEHRAISLALCLTLVDVLLETLRALYANHSHELISNVQGCLAWETERNTFKYIEKISVKSQLSETRRILEFVS